MLPKSLRDAFLLSIPPQARKAIAWEAFPERSHDFQRAEVSRVMQGERRPPWTLLEAILRSGAAGPIVDYVCQVAEHDGGALRRAMTDLASELEHVRAELRALRDDRQPNPRPPGAMENP